MKTFKLGLLILATAVLTSIWARTTDLDNTISDTKPEADSDSEDGQDDFFASEYEDYDHSSSYSENLHKEQLIEHQRSADSLRNTADYLNKLTRHAGVVRAIQSGNFDKSNPSLSRMVELYKKCPGQSLVRPRKEYCVLEVPPNPNQNGLPRDTISDLRRDNQYEVICVCP